MRKRLNPGRETGVRWPRSSIEKVREDNFFFIIKGPAVVAVGAETAAIPLTIGTAVEGTAGLPCKRGSSSSNIRATRRMRAVVTGSALATMSSQVQKLPPVLPFANISLMTMN